MKMTASLVAFFLVGLVLAIGPPARQAIVAAAPDDPKPSKDDPAPEPASIEGVYMAHGVDGAKPYWSLVTIRKLADGLFVVNYLTGETHTMGVGVRTGDSLAVGWTLGTNRGATLYRIDGKKLTGRWVGQIGDKISGPHSETLTWIKGIPGEDL